MVGVLKPILRSIVIKRVFHSAMSLFAMRVELVYAAKSFEGEQRFYSHFSDLVKCKMNIGVYLPPATIKENIKCPVLYFLNGMTSTYETIMQQTGLQRFAAKFGICAVSPDTSPRDVNVPQYECVGPGASFYIDATQEPYANHYQMFSYVTKELIELINTNFPVIENKQSICGFSMGGYGALNCFLKNPELYQSVSAFAPPCNPSKSRDICRTVLETYLGKDEEEWRNWDPTLLIANYTGNKVIEILLDQGTNDKYLKEKILLPNNMLIEAAKKDCVDVLYREREGYDHSYFFITTFIHEHMEYHANLLYLK